MDLATGTLLLVVGVIGVNQALARFPAVRAVKPLFWSILAIDLVVAAYCAFIGLPGFERLPMVSIVLALLVLVHVAQNLSAFQADRRARWVAEQEAKRRALAERALDDGTEVVNQRTADDG